MAGYTWLRTDLSKRLSQADDARIVWLAESFTSCVCNFVHVVVLEAKFDLS